MQKSQHGNSILMLLLTHKRIMRNTSTIHLNKLTKCCHYSIGQVNTQGAKELSSGRLRPLTNSLKSRRVQSPEQKDQAVTYLILRGTKACPSV